MHTYLSVAVEPRLKKRLRIAAAKKDLSLSEYVRLLLEEGLFLSDMSSESNEHAELSTEEVSA